MTVGKTEIRIDEDIEGDYPLGQNMLVSVVVGEDGIGAGIEGEDGWVGDISGEGFSREGSEIKENLSYEYMVAQNPGGAYGYLITNLLRMNDGGVDTTLEYTIFFNLITFVGLVIIVYAIGTLSTIFALLKFFSPFLMTVGYFILLKALTSERVFLELSGLMFLYFVPPMGKESVIPIGIAQGIPWSILAFSIAFVDIVVCLFLIWNFDLAKKLPFIGSGIKRVQIKGAAILESMPWVERLTFFGIVIFVMIPFQGSGAFAGTILGRAVGLSVPAVLGAVGVGALVGSALIALSVVYGLGFLSYLAPLQLAGFIIFIMVCGTLYFVYRHWNELSMDEFTQTLGLHREGVIGAPLTAAGEMVGTAGGTVIKVAEGTGKTVIRAAGDTGRKITKTTTDIVGSFVDTFTDDRYDFGEQSDKTSPTELDTGVLVTLPEGARRGMVVTGGAGFIGSHLVDRLVKRDEHVVVLDNFSSGELEFLFESIENITVVDVDLLKDDFDEYLKGAKIVYHLAANPEVQLGITKPEVMQEQNVDVTERVLEAMKRTGCSRIVFTSTSTVYGDAKTPTPEEADLKPISAYGSSKLDAEILIEKYCKEHDFRGVSYRFANCVGPRSNHGVTYDFVHKLKDNPKELEILGDGKQDKSYFHVDDCISAMLAKAPRELCDAGEFTALNVGSKDSIDVVTLANEVCKSMKLKDVEYTFTGGVDGGRGWKGDVKKMRLDIKKMKSHGWDPQFTSRKAIRDTAKWLDENY
jgi:UDP-glucose 4-epimerase